MNILGMEVVQSSWLPEHLVLLSTGRMLYAWNTQTGEVRSMEWPDPVVLLARMPRDGDREGGK